MGEANERAWKKHVERPMERMNGLIAVSLPVLEDDGSILVVHVPPLTEKGYLFFLEQLDTFRPAIVRKEIEPEATE